MTENVIVLLAYNTLQKQPKQIVEAKQWQNGCSPRLSCVVASRTCFLLTVIIVGPITVMYLPYRCLPNRYFKYFLSPYTFKNI